MPYTRNAFKIRAADASSIETSQFVQLYCPTLLDQLKHDDLFVPKLIVIRGSPGSGKSTLLRLFEADTLAAIHLRRKQNQDEELVTRLQNLGVLSESGPVVFGIYIHCDSSLSDIAHISSNPEQILNALLDIRIVHSFIKSIQHLEQNKCIHLTGDLIFEPLEAGEMPPDIFSCSHRIDELQELCLSREHDFSKLLNSFPDDSLPQSIQPHSRLYSLNYLARQIQQNKALAHIMPIVMLDDVQDLYQEQREHIRKEFIKRSAIPRWFAVRSQVSSLEDLVSTGEETDGREYRLISLDEIFQPRTGVFPKFAANVVYRRLQSTEAMQQISLADFKNLLAPPDETIDPRIVNSAMNEIRTKIDKLAYLYTSENVPIIEGKDATRQGLQKLEELLIVAERKARRVQRTLFPELDSLEPQDDKTEQAAELFLAARMSWPYYYGFDKVIQIASLNVEQLLSTCATIVDRMIYRAELDREKNLNGKDQETILTQLSENYYKELEQKPRGATIRQFIDNLGPFCNSVTYRPNAPIAPGVTGFGMTHDQLSKAVTPINLEATVFREVLTNAVARNVLSVRMTKQGQKGEEKIIFYLNRLLCIKFKLPLNYGGWQTISTPLLIKMMQEPISPRDIKRRSAPLLAALEDEDLE